jgi:hypothetical protein
MKNRFIPVLPFDPEEGAPHPDEENSLFIII